ncbi:MAG TPA: FAD-dependent oxidoreductase [Pseudonocardia sp.]|uniref:FAD-dependent oxidoreductase n=1 Tax=Pseudonocardia sp. TaxID=60912 RepID=UPI002B4B84EF|nr:FAD-dependent oxidoreductase [Pseudonocardia sp.]HLU58042.1 FAD-dependent oxidoreductase [Pseudonocardia sp.]
MIRAPGELEAAVPCPPSLLEPSPTALPTLTTDVAVVGAEAAGAATAWHLARRGLRVTLLERRPAGEVWRSAGPSPWTDAGLPSRLASEAARLWRQVELATGATLLHVVGGVRQVRADQATAALTAAATAWGAELRHCDEVVGIEGAAVEGAAVERTAGALVRTRSVTVSAARVVLAGAGPAALHDGGAAAVGTVTTAGCFAIPALTC